MVGMDRVAPDPSLGVPLAQRVGRERRPGGSVDHLEVLEGDVAQIEAGPVRRQHEVARDPGGDRDLIDDSFGGLVDH